MRNQYTKKIQKQNLYKEFLNILNGLLRLSDREAELLALFMQLDAEWKSILGTTNKDILSTDYRRSILETMGISKTNLAKYIRKFKNKGILVENSLGGIEVNSLFMPKETGGIIEVTFTLDTQDGN